MPLIEATASLGYLFNPFAVHPPAIVEAYGLTSDEILGTAYVDRYAFASTRPTVNAVSRMTSSEAKQPPVVSTDPWLWQTLEAIAAHRGLDEDWLGAGVQPPVDAALDAAEFLASGFAQFPMANRPRFGVDTLGRPSFSAYNDHLYLDLTISADGRASWYRVEDGVEAFGDDASIDPLHVDSLVAEIMSIAL